MTDVIKKPREGSPEKVSTGKKPYKSPEIVEWGTMVDLTRGIQSDTQDFPGGSGGV